MLRGLNWGHRRAIAPILAATERFKAEATDADIVWDVQPLGGFEHGLGPNVVDRYDLVVLDHPFCGSVAAGRWLQPLESILPGIAAEQFVGRSLDSYLYAGHLWALPIDGATQVAAYRADLMSAVGLVPKHWQAVTALGAEVRKKGLWLGLAVKNPHGFLALIALYNSLGHAWATDPLSEPFDSRGFRAALRLLDAIRPALHPDCGAWNAIDLHEAMVSSDEIAYTPLVYGYLTYAEADQRAPLRYADFAGPSGRPAGTVLGGTGLGITRSCRDTCLASRFLQWLAAPGRQEAIVWRDHGQPAERDTWSSKAANEQFGSAFSATLETLESAWVRPRYAGYIRVQDEAGAAVAGYLEGTISSTALERRIREIWLDCPASAPHLKTAGRGAR